MTGTNLSFVFLGILVLSGTPDVRAADPFPQELEGKWTISAHSYRGEQKDTKGEVEFGKDTVTFRIGRKPFTATARVDATKKPAQIDLSYQDGPAKGMTFKGIYRLEGGKLFLCCHPTSRPEAFETPEDTDYFLFTLSKPKRD